MLFGVYLNELYFPVFGRLSIGEDASAAPICLWVADFFAFERLAPNSSFKEHTRLKSRELQSWKSTAKKQ
jgi:hypothetical protein